MKANEFVKKFGWDETKEIVCNFNYNSSNKFITSLEDNSAIHIDDLKQLIEAKELVDCYGTTEEAKGFLHMLRLDSKEELQKAIKLVESVDA